MISVMQKYKFSDHSMLLYARFLCSRAHLAARPSARDDRVSCIQSMLVNKIPNRRARKGILHPNSMKGTFALAHARLRAE